MKKITIAFFIVLFVLTNLKAQDNNDKYCKVFVITYLTKLKEGNTADDFVKLNLGKNTFDSALYVNEIKQLRVVNTFTSDIDVLNYMKSIGWDLVHIASYNFHFANESGRKEFYFRKKFH